MHEHRQSRTTAGAWGRIACAWAVAFATLHFYWALGGNWGLSVSAGPLAETRPAWFVAVGLWGVGMLCLVGGVLGRLLARPRPHGPLGRVVKALGWSVCVVLLVRGIAIEMLLLTDTAGQQADISPQQRLWTLVLWNPWFLVGGLVFGRSAREFGRADGRPPVRGSSPLRGPHPAPTPTTVADVSKETGMQPPSGTCSTGTSRTRPKRP